MSVGFGSVRVWFAVVWLILSVVFISTVAAAVPIDPPSKKSQRLRAEKTLEPLCTTVFENVFVPANVCVPVETSPRAIPEASGRLKVWTFPVEAILKSVPEVPTAKV